MWDESKHPRNKKGQFAEKNGDALKIELDDKPKYTEVKIPFDFFKRKGGKKAEVSGEIPDPPKEAYGFENKERLYTDHHRTHAAEMGYTPPEYEKAAIQFWNSGEGSIYFSPLNKRFYKYNEKTNRFISVSSDGIIHTFMLFTNKRFARKQLQERLHGIGFERI